MKRESQGKFGWVVLQFWMIAWVLFGCGGQENVTTDGSENVDSTLVFALSGFSTPESILFDAVSELYLVSNINGSPADEDGNGFISQVSPDGQILKIKWIDGESQGIDLNAPKGTAIFKDELYVADIRVLRIFNRQTGQVVANVEIAEATFLNDVTVDANGIVYVSDSSTDTIFKVMPDRTYSLFLNGPLLEGLNGLAIQEQTIWATVSSCQKLIAFNFEGEKIDEKSTGVGGMDGLVVTPEGTFLFSSWETETVYAAPSNGQFAPLFANLDSPADIGFDTKEQRVLIPIFKKDKIEVKSLPSSK